ncbi:MAG: hypothetical protein JWN78_3313 [Bacteroidota bacterium]|nr:hypothetical protein [Bacteroidota bacterium]
MKKFFYLVFFVFMIQVGSTFAGFTTKIMHFGGRNRTYVIYVPDIYISQNKAVPLVVGLHGFGDNATDFSTICLSDIADTANYIAVYPEATPDPFLGANAWNSGASTGLVVINSGVDDKGFINAVMDTIIANYKIDTTRMYIFGFSFGGFMTDRMAAEDSKRFAAAANVSGLRGNSVTALPQVSMPYMHFHGTSDQTISYDGNSTMGFLPGLGMGAEKTVKFWVKQNHCDTIPVIDSMPDIANDGLRFVRFTYNNGTDNVKVIFYKVIGGTHTWYSIPTNDISYCQTIWAFFRQYSRRSTVTAIRNNSGSEIFKIYPNPSNGLTTVDFSTVKERVNSLNIYNTAGELSFSVSIKDEQQIILNDKIPAGMYVVQLTGEHGVIATQKIILQ